MWRIHLTVQDLARVRLAPAADPACELWHSLRIVNGSAGEAVFGRWRRACRRRFGGALHRLAELGSAGGYASTPVRTYFDRAVAPHWPVIHGHVAEDLSQRRATLASGGVGGLFEVLSPWLQWEGMSLAMTRTDVDHDLHSNGRGLMLQPSFFLYDELSVRWRPSGPLVLIYPVAQRPGWFNADVDSAEVALKAVLGRTRVRVLDLLAESRSSTSETARRLGISLASASQELSRLRAAGLVASTPHGKLVMHDLTALGRDLRSQRVGTRAGPELDAVLTHAPRGQLQPSHGWT
ncbi:winged helix-turn-helix domain-containing protein [Nocardioides speluncae]|uniref:winged helix-turn-helix domain-containing protein n=1 Tax=Nocardioides speluncae TaxID=2670337 RepID=UPI000D686402|nr:winged helix-turn-helix domain-containing protein [Nocardioides speluncae]